MFLPASAVLSVLESRGFARILTRKDFGRDGVRPRSKTLQSERSVQQGADDRIWKWIARLMVTGGLLNLHTKEGPLVLWKFAPFFNQAQKLLKTFVWQLRQENGTMNPQFPTLE